MWLHLELSTQQVCVGSSLAGIHLLLTLHMLILRMRIDIHPQRLATRFPHWSRGGILQLILGYGRTSYSIMRAQSAKTGDQILPVLP
jgi:hypothetical protein